MQSTFEDFLSPYEMIILACQNTNTTKLIKAKCILKLVGAYNTDCGFNYSKIPGDSGTAYRSALGIGIRENKVDLNLQGELFEM